MMSEEAENFLMRSCTILHDHWGISHDLCAIQLRSGKRCRQFLHFACGWIYLDLPGIGWIYLELERRTLREAKRSRERPREPKVARSPVAAWKIAFRSG